MVREQEACSTSFSHILDSNDGTATTNNYHHSLIFNPGSDSVNSYIHSTPFSTNLGFSAACFPLCVIHGVEQAPLSEHTLAAFVLSDITPLLSVDDPSTTQLPWLTKSEFDLGGSKFEPPRRCKVSLAGGIVL